MRNMMSQYGRPDAQHIAVLLTAGHSTRDQHKTVTEAYAAKKDHIKIFVIGALRFRSDLQHNSLDHLSEKKNTYTILFHGVDQACPKVMGPNYSLRL